MVLILKNILRKALMLMLVTILPVSIYLYTKDDGQYSFNINKKEALTKYLITAEFIKETKRVAIEEEIIFTNQYNKKMDKLYFHIYPNAFKEEGYLPFQDHELKTIYPNGFDPGYMEIKEVEINNEGSLYKIIGPNNTILALRVPDSIAVGEEINIKIKCSIKIPNALGGFGYNEDICTITNWYPILAVYDSKGWHLDPYYRIKSPFYSEVSHYHVKLITPKEIIPTTTGAIIKRAHIGDKSVFHIEANYVRGFSVVLSE